MSDYPTATSTTHVIAGRCTVRWHCAHVGGEMSIEAADYPCTVYICGSRSEIVAWANAVRAEAIRGEEGE